MPLLTRPHRFIKSFLASLIVVTALSSCSISRGEYTAVAPYGSFAYIKGDAPTVEIAICQGDECMTIKDDDGLHIAGSGVAVANSRVDSERQYVMTAGHICSVVDDYRASLSSKYINSSSTINRVDVSLTMTMYVKDNFGGRHIAKVIGLNSARDICILAIRGANLPLVKVASGYPVRGAKIFNLAAPLGVWEPGTTNRFDGYYSGPVRCTARDEGHYQCDRGEPLWTMVTLPATHGSSGSPLFTRRGQLFGIVVMVTKRFSHVVYAVRLEDMTKLLDEVMEFEASPEGMKWQPDFEGLDSVTGATKKVAPKDPGAAEGEDVSLRYSPGR